MFRYTEGLALKQGRWTDTPAVTVAGVTEICNEYWMHIHLAVSGYSCSLDQPALRPLLQHFPSIIVTGDSRAYDYILHEKDCVVLYATPS